MHRLIRCLVGTLAIPVALSVVYVPSASAQTARPQDKSSPSRDHLLLPGDLIRLQIWREPELSGDYVVDEAGIVVLPLLGPRTVTGIGLDSLKAELAEGFSHYLTHRSITVTPMRRINVLGAVGQPGLHPVDATMTIADVLALAGGATIHGQSDKVDLLRDGERISARLSQQTLIGDLPIQSGDQLYVPERNWISRNAGVVSAIISATISIILAVSR